MLIILIVVIISQSRLVSNHLVLHLKRFTILKRNINRSKMWFFFFFGRQFGRSTFREINIHMHKRDHQQ